MGLLAQFRPYLAVLPKARRNRTDLIRWLARRPQLLGANAGYELALLTSARMPVRLKMLAELKTSTLITCEYCIDIGSALCQRAGLTAEQVRDLPTYRTSDAFDPDEKLVLELAEAMTRVPTEVPDELRARLLARFTPAAVVELMSTIAWENHRGRLNQGLGVRPSGFSEGMVCAVPELSAAQ
ncbi:MAG TPA: carboxymuconolactone decarboxylase family protein [Jatrophihabitans sp.]|nr:carboxymuconolactone decarboxylase family protein [Jatrophihabitans sp.]